MWETLGVLQDRGRDPGQNQMGSVAPLVRVGPTSETRDRFRSDR